MRKIRGNEIAMVFQDPMTSLNPLKTIGAQIAESLRLHQGLSRSEARAKAVDALREVGIPAPERRAGDYPHQFSGGMRQRAMIAMALACRPKILIADEPTTALDVTVQAQIMELLAGLQERFGMAIVLITHDLGVVARAADQVLVMYGGRPVELAPVDDVFADPRMPYTRALLHSMPRSDVPGGAPLDPIPGAPPSLFAPPDGCAFHPRCSMALPECAEPGAGADREGAGAPRRVPARRESRMSDPLLPIRRGSGMSDPLLPIRGESGMSEPLLSLRGVRKEYTGHFGRSKVVAVDDVSLDIRPGETLGLVGESGCGKTTLTRVILRLVEASGGEIWFDGRELLGLGRRELLAVRENMQVVLQDPYASLNPRMRVGEIVAEPLVTHGRVGRGRAGRGARAGRRAAGSGRAGGGRPGSVPARVSGGQRQRIGIARALALEPKLVICTSRSARSTCRSRRRSST